MNYVFTGHDVKNYVNVLLKGFLSKLLFKGACGKLV